MIRAIIVDDEPIAIRHLKKILAQLHYNIEIIQEVTEPDKLIMAVSEERPDVIFLDIDFNRNNINGLKLADNIFELFPDIIIIYISAYNEFKSEAWERKAVVLGYIDKPFNKIKVDRVLAKLERYNPNDKIEIKDKDNVLHFLSPNEIVMFEREKNKKNTIVHCEDKILNTSDSLSAVEKKIKGTKLLRVSRSHIININKIESLLIYSESSYMIKFKNSLCEAYITRETAHELGLVSK